MIVSKSRERHGNRRGNNFTAVFRLSEARYASVVAMRMAYDVCRAMRKRSLRQRANDSSGFVDNLAHDVAGRLHLRHETDALSGPQRRGIDVSVCIGAGRVRLIANDRTDRL